jgi:hypothetical protein
MEITQISVFLENSPGRLGDVTRVLADAGINLRAISIADTADFGILRLILDKSQEAVAALGKAGYTTRLSKVAAVEIADKPGALADVMELFKNAGINIEYLYASLQGDVGKAVMIFKLKNEDHERGLKLIQDKGLKLVDKF